jgi:hypothetical protein
MDEVAFLMMSKFDSMSGPAGDRSKPGGQTTGCGARYGFRIEESNTH